MCVLYVQGRYGITCELLCGKKIMQINLGFIKRNYLLPSAKFKRWRDTAKVEKKGY